MPRIEQGKVHFDDLVGTAGYRQNNNCEYNCPHFKSALFYLKRHQFGRQGCSGSHRNCKALQKGILFIDEIHRFNKGQQDALLAAVEKGIITLIGATTENPSFGVIALCSAEARYMY